jgi:hypothetical protein
VRRRNAGDRTGAFGIAQPGDAIRRRGDRDRKIARLRYAELAAHERAPHAVGRADLLVGHATLVADPGVVHGVVPARHVAVDLVVRDAEVDVATIRAARADARHVVEEPDADLEPEILRGERADRTDVGDVHRVVVVERNVRKRLDHRIIAAVHHHEFARLGHLAAEAHTAPAQDAALLVEHDRRPERHVLLERAARLARARGGDAVLVRVVLELALAGLVADRAVERVVDEQELHHALTRLLHARRVGANDHAVRHRGVAGDLELRQALHLDLTQAARAVDRELRVPAVVRHVYAVHEQAGVVERLEQRAALGNLERISVDGDARHL